MANPELFDALVNLTKRRGFVFPSDEIYGGLRSNYDYGPLGALLLQNVRREWWRTMVQERTDVVGLDAAILTNPKVFEASGHLDGFTDPLVECKACHERFREDQLEEAAVCPKCGARDQFTEPRQFNLMFKTHAGVLENEGSVVYLRPETAQGIFVNFKNVLETSRKKPPFGIAQVGKSFRNEITPGNFVFRTREFEQMEMEFFVPHDEEPQWFEYWLNARMDWYVNLGIAQEQLRFRAHDPEELSHYSQGTTDIEFDFPWGWGELEGIARRGTYDLSQHAKFSGQKMDYFDSATGERYTPMVVEPAAGVTRTAMAFLLAGYEVDSVGGEERTVLRLDTRIAPYQVAILPLSKKPELMGPAKELVTTLAKSFRVDYDETQSIGRRYRRCDEIGTPFAITYDFDTLDDQAVTVRDRDTTKQERISIDKLRDYLADRCK